ncbi:F-box protein SKIP23-like [Pistacia vera]|uniref:F-box protein SKIP23-like n=1 Tax=Pistacia vera TaxID=55513 RepID=UPI001262D041|nr:F-box protein SKIP23-like [Pistacia vera]
MWTSSFLAYLCNYSSTVFVSELDNNDAQLGRTYEDLLVEIVRRIRLREDFVSFRCVCRSWKSVAVEENFRYKSIQLPWLLLPPQKCSHVRDFYLISNKGIYRKVILPESIARNCYSSKGWLITIAPDLSMSLVHPFFHVENNSLKPHLQIKPPHIKTIKNWVKLKTLKIYVYFIWKFILSSSPLSTSDYTLMIIYGGTGKLAYFRPGDKAWNILDLEYGYFWDVVYYHGRFYAINSLSELKTYHISSGKDNTSTKVEKVSQLPLPGWLLDKAYIVESGEVKNLGNRALFLGHSSSLSIEASEATGCKPNCIYFTDDCVEKYVEERNGGGKDMGIYNMEDGSVTPFFIVVYVTMLSIDINIQDIDSDSCELSKVAADLLGLRLYS